MSHLDELDQLLARTPHDGDDALRHFALALAAETNRPAPVPSPRLAAFLDHPRLTPGPPDLMPVASGSPRRAPRSKRRPALGWLVRATLAAVALVLAGTAAVAAVRHVDGPPAPHPAPAGRNLVPHHDTGPVRREAPTPITPTSTTPSAPRVHATSTKPAPRSTDPGDRKGRLGQTSTGDTGQHDDAGDSSGDGSADTSGSDLGSHSAPSGSDDQSGSHGTDGPGPSAEPTTGSGEGT